MMWGGSYDIDPHEETGTATVQWSGGVKDELSTKDADLKQDMAFAPYATFSTSVPETFPTDNSSGFIGSPVYTRCDMVYSPMRLRHARLHAGLCLQHKKDPRRRSTCVADPREDPQGGSAELPAGPTRYHGRTR